MLEHGSSREIISRNIRTEMRAGKSHVQAIAIALQFAKVPRRRKVPKKKTVTRAPKKKTAKKKTRAA